MYSEHIQGLLTVKGNKYFLIYKNITQPLTKLYDNYFLDIHNSEKLF